MGDQTAVLVGVAQAYLAPAATSTPAFATSGLVTPPTTPWAAIGFTEGGVTFSVDRKITNIMAEEQSTPVEVVPDTTDVTVEFTCLEDTILNMQTAYGGGTITVTAPGSTQAGLSALTLADALETLAVAFVGTNKFGLARLVYIPTVISGGKVKTTYNRAKAARQYAVSLSAVCPMSSIVITDATAPHS